MPQPFAGYYARSIRHEESRQRRWRYHITAASSRIHITRAIFDANTERPKEKMAVMPAEMSTARLRKARAAAGLPQLAAALYARCRRPPTGTRTLGTDARRDRSRRIRADGRRASRAHDDADTSPLATKMTRGMPHGEADFSALRRDYDTIDDDISRRRRI